jgi:hypothetical protein
MNLTFFCPRCQHGVRGELAPGQDALDCSQCGQTISLPAEGFEGGKLRRCLVCPSTDLFVRKDFPQRLGVAIVVLGIIASSIAWGYTLPIVTFVILFATAVIDVVLYLIVPDALMCYRCGAMYRGVESPAEHGAFNLQTHERYRQQAARLAAVTSNERL